MPLTLDENRATYQIRSYQPGTIQVNDKLYHHSIILGPDLLIEDWEPQTLKDLTSQHLTVIHHYHPTILIIGTGAECRFPSVEIYGDLINQGIGVEIMDTRAACRTFNALTAENRNVMAALIIDKILNVSASS